MQSYRIRISSRRGSSSTSSTGSGSSNPNANAVIYPYITVVGKDGKFPLFGVQESVKRCGRMLAIGSVTSPTSLRSMAALTTICQRAYSFSIATNLCSELTHHGDLACSGMYDVLLKGHGPRRCFLQGAFCASWAPGRNSQSGGLPAVNAWKTHVASILGGF